VPFWRIEEASLIQSFLLPVATACEAAPDLPQPRPNGKALSPGEDSGLDQLKSTADIRTCRPDRFYYEPPMH